MESLLLIAAQDPTGALAQTEHPLWPYWVAVAALASAVVFLFGVIVKQNRDFQAELIATYAAQRELDTQRSKRVSDEHERKDQKLYDLGNNSAVMIERVASKIEGLTSQISEIRRKDNANN